jgi:alpha-N-acetylglucosaminidase
LPRSFKEKFPGHHINLQSYWHFYEGLSFLHTDDILFGQFASAYYTESIRLYGKRQFYGGDPFHEGHLDFDVNVKQTGKIVQQQMLNANPNAVWVLQCWFLNPFDELLDGIAKK